MRNRIVAVLAGLACAVEGATLAGVVEDRPGYNAWPMLAASSNRLVCVYSRGRDHSYIHGERDAWARRSEDGGCTWSDSVAVATDPAVAEVPTGKGLDLTGAMLFWIRAWGSTGCRHDLYRTVDGLSFERISRPALDPMPMQITDIVRLGDRLFCLWFACDYGPGGRGSWGTLVSADGGRTWRQTTVEADLPNGEIPMEPSVVVLPGNRLLAVARCEDTDSPEARQFQLTSGDGGQTWMRRRTNIGDIFKSTPSLVYDSATDRICNYYYERGKRRAKRRVALGRRVFESPEGWPASEIVARGSEKRPWDAGNVNVAACGDVHYLAFYSGDERNTSVSVRAVPSASPVRWTTVVKPLPGEKWWGGVLQRGGEMPYGNTPRPIDLNWEVGVTAPFLVSSAGRYVWSDRPFTYAFTNDVLTISSGTEKVEPVVAGTTLREAYLAASAKHFPFNGKTPAELLFTKPQWNNWIEIAIQGMNQTSVDAYTEAVARSGFPCGVYIMDGGWLSHSGSYRFYAPDFPDPKGMFRRIREKGWKTMIWTAAFVSPDSREYKLLRHGKGYRITGKDVLAYDKSRPGRHAGVEWWWSGISCVWDLTYGPGWDDYVQTLQRFAAEYGIDGFKWDAGEAGSMERTLRFHDPDKRAVDWVHEYVRIGAEKFPYNEYRVGFCTGGMPVMQRLPDVHHRWDNIQRVSGMVQAAGLLGSPYVVADMVGGGEATTYRPGGFFSEKLFMRSCALAALHPMMQFSAAPWRYLSPENVEICRAFANLHVDFAPYILELVHQAARTGEPIVRTMEYEFPHAGFAKPMTQFMLGSKWLVAPVTAEDDTVTVELPAGRWTDDLGIVHIGPKTLLLKDVPLSRLPRYVRENSLKK